MTKCGIRIHQQVVLFLVIVLVAYVRCDDIEASYNVTQLIQARGYTCEQHEVVTRDGFVLSIQRIPAKAPKGVVFLQHGILDASETWVQNFESQSLAFILSDAGYDVWLGNIRGNIYSNRNIKYSRDDREFWNWSWDEMAFIDLPTMINYVLSVTNKSSIDAYIGHSQGTAMGFACFSTSKCEAYGKAKVFIALAPVTFVKHVKSELFQLMAQFRVDKLLNFLGFGAFLPDSDLLRFLIPNLCEDSAIDKSLCLDVYCLISGCDTLMDNVNVTRLDVYFSHLPAGTSVINMAHWAQLIRSDTFRMYDYGESGNMEKYGIPEPPNYNLTELNVDIALFHGELDALGDPKDTSRMIPMLPKERVIFNKGLPNYGHLDIVWGLQANKDIYVDVLKIIAKYID